VPVTSVSARSRYAYVSFRSVSFRFGFYWSLAALDRLCRSCFLQSEGARVVWKYFARLYACVMCVRQLLGSRQHHPSLWKRRSRIATMVFGSGNKFRIKRYVDKAIVWVGFLPNSISRVKTSIVLYIIRFIFLKSLNNCRQLFFSLFRLVDCSYSFT